MGPGSRTASADAEGSEHACRSLRFSPDGRLLTAAGDDGAIRIWAVPGDDPVVLTGTVGQTSAISFSPDGKLIAGVDSDDVVRVWNTEERAKYLRQPG